jgi:hypothetical protein
MDSRDPPVPSSVQRLSGGYWAGTADAFATLITTITRNVGFTVRVARALTVQGRVARQLARGHLDESGRRRGARIACSCWAGGHRTVTSPAMSGWGVQ